jgi:transposase
MAIRYRPYEPQQEMLLPASLQDWLPKGHLAYFISDTVDALDLKAFYARYAGGGARNQPFHPAMMVKLLVYGYATGVFSSRKIERRLHDDLAFRMLGAGNFPKHRTIRDFRALHLLELSDLFVQVVKLAREMGLVKLGTVAIDGTKIKANASRHKAMSYERMQQAEAELKAQIDALLERAKTTDAAEADEPELDIPAEIERREMRLKAIVEARERLEQRQREADIERGRSDDDECKPRDEDGNPKGGRYKREFGVPEPKAQDNFTDPCSRIMTRTGGAASIRASTPRRRSTTRRTSSWPRRWATTRPTWGSCCRCSRRLPRSRSPWAASMASPNLDIPDCLARAHKKPPAVDPSVDP